MINQIGPSMEPWGSSWGTDKNWDSVWLKISFWILKLKCELIN